MPLNPNDKHIPFRKSELLKLTSVTQSMISLLYFTITVYIAPLHHSLPPLIQTPVCKDTEGGWVKCLSQGHNGGCVHQFHLVIATNERMFLFIFVQVKACLKATPCLLSQIVVKSMASMKRKSRFNGSKCFS